jgi:hypothetical protein
MLPLYPAAPISALRYFRATTTVPRIGKFTALEAPSANVLCMKAIRFMGVAQPELFLSDGATRAFHRATKDQTVRGK